MKKNISLMTLVLAIVIGFGFASVLLAQAAQQASKGNAPAPTDWYCPCPMMQNTNYPGPVARGSNVPARPYCPYWNATTNTQASAVAPGSSGRGVGRGRFAPGTGRFCPFNPYNNPAAGTATGSSTPTGNAPAQSTPVPAAK
jgi:hypothetical protein